MVKAGFAGHDSELEDTSGAAIAAELRMLVVSAAPGHADSDGGLPEL